MHLSVIVPAYNEEKMLDKNIKVFFNYLKEQSYDFEIIIVNDGSTDKTAAIVRELEKEIKEVKLINNKINKGKGAAVRQGLLAARGEYCLFIDADNATSIDHLDKVWPELRAGYDIVIGSRNSRDAKGAKIAVPQPVWKIFFGKFGNILIQALTVRGIWDTQCGFKVFTKKIVTDIIPRTTVNRWAFDVEILALAKSKNYKIAKIPVRWVNSGISRVGLKGYFTTLLEMLKIKKNFLLGKYTRS